MSECGCRVEVTALNPLRPRDASALNIIYCSLHQNAWRLLEAAKMVRASRRVVDSHGWNYAWKEMDGAIEAASKESHDR